MAQTHRELLIEGVDFLQANLTPTNSFLSQLLEADVLEQSDLWKIKKDEMQSGRIVELVCILKEKPENVIVQFAKEAEKSGFSKVSQYLQFLTPKGAVNTPRTKYIDKIINRKYSVDQATIEELADGIVLKKVYNDHIGLQEDKLEELNETIVRLKEEIEQKEEYIKKLKNKKENVTVVRVTTEDDSIGCEIESKQSEFDELQEKYHKIKDEIEQVKDELDDAKYRYEHYCKKLKVDPKSPDIGDTIDKLMKEKRLSKQEAEAAKKNIADLKADVDNKQRRINTLEIEKTSAESEKQRLSDQIEELAMELGKSKDKLTKQGRDSVAETGSNDSADESGDTTSIRSFCIFCKEVHEREPETACNTHWLPFQYGRWLCCNTENKDADGCLNVDHVYVERQAPDWNAFLRKWNERSPWTIN